MFITHFRVREPTLNQRVRSSSLRRRTKRTKGFFAAPLSKAAPVHPPRQWFLKRTKCLGTEAAAGNQPLAPIASESRVIVGKRHIDRAAVMEAGRCDQSLGLSDAVVRGHDCSCTHHRFGHLVEQVELAVTQRVVNEAMRLLLSAGRPIEEVPVSATRISPSLSICSQRG